MGATRLLRLSILTIFLAGRILASDITPRPEVTTGSSSVARPTHTANDWAFCGRASI